jgi:hypothetical protein
MKSRITVSFFTLSLERYYESVNFGSNFYYSCCCDCNASKFIVVELSPFSVQQYFNCIAIHETITEKQKTILRKL